MPSSHRFISTLPTAFVGFTKGRDKFRFLTYHSNSQDELGFFANFQSYWLVKLEIIQATSLEEAGATSLEEAGANPALLTLGGVY